MALFGNKKKHKQANLFGEHEHGHHQMPPQKRHGSGKSTVYAVVAIIIIAIAAYSFYFLSVNQTVVMAPATVNLTSSGTVFSINSEQYLISLSSASLVSDRAYIHISKLPIFINPLLNVTLSLNNITKVNAGTNYSNMGVQLLSLSANSITVKVSPLFTSLQIAPDYQDIKTVQSTLYNSEGSSQSTAATTTIPVTTVSTTAGPTTTIKTVNNTALEVSNALQKNTLYSLLLNFSKLYANTTGCTSVLYNTTYIRVHGHAPGAGSRYTDVSPYVPYNLSGTTTGTGSGNYEDVFKTQTISSLYNNTVAVTIKVNASTEETLNETFAAGGVFSGLNYSKLSLNYLTAQSAGGECGVEV